MTQTVRNDAVAAMISRTIGSLVDRPGRIFYSNFDTLAEGSIYVLGLNPGGDPLKNGTIREDMERKELSDPEYSGLDENWWRNKSDTSIDTPHKDRPYQRSLKKVLKVLGYEDYRKHAFITDAIFLRTLTANGLEVELTPDLELRCKNMHYEFLKIIRPKIILCVGNGKFLSPYFFLQKWSSSANFEKIRMNENESNESFKDGKFAKVTFDFPQEEGLHSNLIGIPHPSRFNFNEKLKVNLEKFRISN